MILLQLEVNMEKDMRTQSNSQNFTISCKQLLYFVFMKLVLEPIKDQTVPQLVSDKL